MVFGIKVLEIPPYVGKKFSIFAVWNTMCIVNSLGIRWNRSPCRSSQHLSFTTLVFRSISGTCSLALSRLIMGPPGSDTIRAWSGANSPSECTVVMRNPWCKLYWYISLKAANICNTVRFAIWFTAVKHIFKLKVKRNGILFTKKSLALRTLPCVASKGP